MSGRTHTLFIIFLFLLVAACEQLDESPINQTPRPIIGGTETNYAEWRGVIGIMYCPNFPFCHQLCSGTLIDPQVVLTAGHCFYYTREPNDYDYRNEPENIYIVGGAEMKFAFTNSMEIVQHPDWLGDITANGVDLTMITLSEPIEHIESLDLSLESYGITKEAPSIGLAGKIIGYGRSEGSDPSSAGVHRVGDTEIQGFLTPDIMELGDPTNICAGDSGGPFLVEQNGDYNVAGVASFGFDPTCPADHDGHFVNLYTFRPWINDTMVDMVGYGIDMATESDAGKDASTDPFADSGPGDDPDNASSSDTGGSVVGTDFPSDGGVFPRSGQTAGCQLAPEPGTSSLIDRVLLVLF